MTIVDSNSSLRDIGSLSGAIIAIALAGCGLSLTTSLLSVRLHIAGFSAHAIGLNMAAGGVATLASAPLVSWLARRVGVVPMLLGSLLITAAAMVGFTLTADYAVWLILRFVIGVCATIMFVLSEFWITSRAPPRWRGFTIGLYIVALAAGFAAGPLVFAATDGGNRPFLVGGLIFIGAAVPLAFNVRSAPDLEARVRNGLFRYVREMPVGALAAVLHGIIEFACMSFLPIYALRIGLGVERGALYATLFVVGNGLLQLPIGLIADRLDRDRLLLALAVAGGVGAIVLAMQQEPPGRLFEAGLLLWGGIVGAFYPVGLGELGRRYAGDELAGANAVFVMAYAVGMLIGPSVVGAGLDLGSPAGLFWVLAVVIGLYVLFVGAHLGLGRRNGFLRSDATSFS